MSRGLVKKFLMTKDKYIPTLLQLFRLHGYDGATLSKISQATGLGKASLYHHFPGGKEEMVAVILEYLKQWFQENILTALQGEGGSQERLEKMCEQVGKLYAGGKQPCVFAILLLGSARDIFHEPVKALLKAWIAAIGEVLIQAGLEATTAQERSEDALLAIQGALILAQGLDDLTPFVRVLAQLPQQLLR
jgi:AcrR family transcriptional regulator